jgi:capsular exopolysaccharide synthesis family protein
LSTLRKRRLVLLIAIALGAAYGIYTAVTQPRLYIATGRIQVRTGASNEYRVGGFTSAAGDTSTRMLTEVTIIKSDTLLLTVAKEMDLANNPDFLGAKGPVPHRDLNNPSVREGTIRRLRSSLAVDEVPKTDIITLRYSSLNAKLSADIVNKVIDEYIQRSFKTRYTSVQHVSEWLSGQLDELKQQVETSQQRMIDLQKRLGIMALDPNHSEITSALDALTTAASQARINRIIAESRYRVLKGLDPDTIEGTIDTTPGTSPIELNQLRSQLATEKASYAQMTANYGLGPNNPAVQASKAKIAELTSAVTKEQDRLLTQAKENFVAAQANERETTAALEGQKTEAYKLRDDLVEYTLRQREFESNRSLYEGLVDRLRTAEVQAGLESLEIDVVDQALPPASPTLEPVSTLVLTRLFFGLLAGVVLAFLLESLDTGMSGITEIEQVTELPSLAIVPRARRMTPEQTRNMSTAQRNMAVLTMPKSQFAEAFRSLRTSLMLSSAGHPPKIILFTSATPSEGKTTSATNLACILAQRETRVLLLDADLRRPNIHHRFGLNGKVGLTTVLTGSTTLEEAIQHIPEVPNLDILPSGPVPPFPTEMLASDAMNSLLQRCIGEYTHIVMDSPPILSVTDGVLMARHADAVVLVVRHAKSNKHVVRRARDLLVRSGAAITGVVLNAVDLNSPEYYGYYGYSGYSYTSIDSESWESTTGSSSGGKGAGPSQ